MRAIESGDPAGRLDAIHAAAGDDLGARHDRVGSRCRSPAAAAVRVVRPVSGWIVGGDQSSRLYNSTPVTDRAQRRTSSAPNALKWDAREQDLRAVSADREYLEAREDVAVNTATAFFDLFSARLALDNAASKVAINDTLFNLNKGRFEVGKIGENDLLQSELALLQARYVARRREARLRPRERGAQAPA